ncbi:E3 ubiquitin-protein ligase TRAF7 [Geodia barretti]|uniref:E3 ubiquitin-protein ligase TRAF7 n=1 Tax=Geodia barretti TaxID=519541 RepID=A0AA35XKE0_GEOBA|nr:E3 ubiquitin-protein ligase TRAF7 [Geodia barretti]
MDSTKLSLLVRNLAVAEEVGELLDSLSIRLQKLASALGTFEVDPNGCPAKIKLGKRGEHEKECGYAPVYCPNSSVCGKMLRSELDEHRKTCQYQRCPHYKYNCRFQGTPEEIEGHLNTCKYEGVKGFLQQVEGEVKMLRGSWRRETAPFTLSPPLWPLSPLDWRM